MQERYQIKPVPEPKFVDEDGAWYSQEHKQYMMSQKSYWEEQNKGFQKDPEQEDKSEQYAFQQNYIKATPEDKRSKHFFKELDIENIVDDEAI